MPVQEMARNLRQTVENSFEEGQFQSAVAMLSQLRSVHHTPSVIHVLHLMFIARHPYTDSELNEDGPPLDNATLLLQSPRKIIKHQKASLMLPASAVIAAQQLLMSFLVTNEPQVFGDALPSYPESKNEPPMQLDFSESLIFDQAAAIKHSKNCWEILKSSFSASAIHLPGTQKGKTKRTSSIRFAEPSYKEQGDHEDIKVVADDAWFLLEWLVSLFERDAQVVKSQGKQRHSPLLSKQLPPPPMGSSARWDASEPVKVIFFAFQQSDARRKRSGMRLLNLLIDLSQTPFLNLPSLASTVLAHLTTFSHNSSSPTEISTGSVYGLPGFNEMFDALGTTPSALSFKMALCKRMIDDASDSPAFSSFTTEAVAFNVTPQQNPAPGGLKKPAPRAVARPVPRKPRGIAREESSQSIQSTEGVSTESTSALPSEKAESPSKPPSLPSTYIARLPSFEEIVRLCRTPCIHVFEDARRGASVNAQKPWAISTLMTRVKFELLLAYTLAQLSRKELSSAPRVFGDGSINSQPPPDKPDATFLQSLQDQTFSNLLNELFAPNSSNDDRRRMDYNDILRALVGLPLIFEEGDIEMS